MPARLGPQQWFGRPRRFAWQGHDQTGQACAGVLLADNAELARARLRRQGIAVHTLHWQWRSPAPASTAQLAASTRQWATLMRAGVHLVPALQMLARSAAPVLAAVLQAVRGEVERGTPLAQALAQHPAQFNALYVGMVQAGEAAGILDAMLERLADTLEANAALQRRLRGALAYPMAVGAIALVVLLALLLGVVPVFEEVFEALGAPLPWSTQAVLGLSRALSAHPVALLLACALLGAGAVRAAQDPRWRLAWQRRVLDWPGLGPLLALSVCARWAHTLAALLAAGVPLAEALPGAGQSAQHPVYARIGVHLQRRVAQGGRLSEAMAHTSRFPPLLVQLCATGEDSGMLATMLARAAELLGEELETRIASTSRLIEPLVVVLMGVVIGVILVAMYLPIFQLGQAF